LSWEVGILLYKLLFGVYPFKRNGRKIKAMFEDVITKEIDFKDVPVQISGPCKLILTSLLKKDQLARLSIITNNDFQIWYLDK